MTDRFELGDRVVCIKEYETLKVGQNYRISGCGDLSWNSSANKKGYGFMIESHLYKQSIKCYYFTEKEMDEYFITEQEDYKAYLRDQKIKQVLS